MTRIVTALALMAFASSAALAQSSSKQSSQNRPVGANEVICSGGKIGKDPDPFIRMELLRQCATPD